MLRILCACLFAVLLTPQTYAKDTEDKGDVRIWPKIKSPYGLDPVIESNIDTIMSKMTLEEKVGQMMQGEITTVTPADVKKFHLGSVLNGGDAKPGRGANAPIATWLAAANAYHDASVDTQDGRVAIPIIWGTDAVHGHNNVRGATIFPHNIGLGAANNPGLMRDIGIITAREVAATGIKWVFAPTVATVQNDQWGRTYESYSEDPKIVAELTKEIVVGLQGHPKLNNALNEQKVIATAKHFIGDGGTKNGKDQGETTLSEKELFDIHGQGYVKAIGAGVQTVMASYNSWNGKKMHGNEYLLTTVLKERMGFDGLIVSDWNAHEQVPGCSTTSCPQAVNAGIDIFMVSKKWRSFYVSTLKQVKSGLIPIARIDDAVRRILRVKMRAGLFDMKRPSEREIAARFDLVGHPQHRAVARQAVRESLVLLKNNGVLPLKPSANIIVAGSGANSIPRQAGGWSVTWQGDKTSNDDFPGATSVFDGFRELVEASGGVVAKNRKALKGKTPDAAVIVLSEKPYAEWKGDLKAGVGFPFGQSGDLGLLKSYKAKGIPVVAVILSGRPLAVPPLLEKADAFVAAWLPGSEGAGIADVLIGNENRQPVHDFTGKLSFSWPASSSQTPLNFSDENYAPLFPLGYGLRYSGKVATE